MNHHKGQYKLTKVKSGWNLKLKEGCVIATIPNMKGGTNATRMPFTAALLQAAPDMYSDLKMALQDLEVMAENYGEGEDADLVNETITQIEKVISKVELGS
jgi:hypothetical protein